MGADPWTDTTTLACDAEGWNNLPSIKSLEQRGHFGYLEDFGR
jgi:hypothetical protein